MTQRSATAGNAGKVGRPTAAGSPAALPADPGEALGTLFLVHSRSLVGLARLLVDDVATAEDVVQDAFAATYRRWRSIRDPEAALPYLRSAVLNFARKRVRQRQHGGRVAQLVERTGRAAEPADPHDALDALEQRRLVLAALRTLPYRQRQVLVLRYYLDQSEAQVAATLGLSRGSVHQHAVRGAAALARRLGDHEGPGATP